MKKIIQIIIVYFTIGLIYGTPADSSDYRGIRFFSYYDDNQPTVINLTPNASIPLEDQFTLSFDFAIWKTSPFGYITSGKHNGESFFLLTYVDFKNPDTSYFELSFSSGKESITIGKPKKELNKDKWQHFELGVDLTNNIISMSLDGESKETAAILPDEVNLNLIFGTSPMSNDSPNMNLRSIELKGSSNRVWPLTEGNGNLIYEQFGHEAGMLIGGQSLKSENNEWVETFTLNRDFREICLVSRNKNDVLMIWWKDSLITINTETWESEEHILLNHIHKNFNPIVDKYNDEIKGYNAGGDGPIATWNDHDMKWENYDSVTTSDQYHGSGSIIDPKNGDLYTIGGYGHYRLKNHIQKYDAVNQKWDTLKVKNVGNENLSPRQPLAIAWDDENESILIFGGWGNESGQQEKGFNYIYDLWSFNPDSYTLEKIWDWEVSHQGLKPIASILIPERNEIYLYGKLENNLGDSLIFFQSSLDKPDFKQIDITSSFNSLNWVSIYYKNQKLLLVNFKPTPTFHIGEMKIFTIDLPLGNKAQYVGTPLVKRIDAATKWVWIILVVGITTIGFSVFIWRQNQFAKIGNQSSILDKTPIAPTRKIISNGGLKKGITLQLDDEFQLWVDGKTIDLNGNERHNQIVELLALLANSPENKLSHEDIHQSLWPLVQDESFVNSLNVTLSAIRKVISPYEKEIIHQNKMVAFGKGIRVLKAD